MAAQKKHADHDYIVARQERYVAAYRTGDAKKMMEWMDTAEDFVYSDFGGDREGLNRDEVMAHFELAFSGFHDLAVKTRSLHGHKHFTAWEWTITCKQGIDENGQKIPKAKAPPKKLLGCTLMWWNDHDKIVKNHDYVQQREP